MAACGMGRASRERRRHASGISRKGLRSGPDVSTHEGWNVWLIGDRYRSAALVMTLPALVVLWFETTLRDAWHSTHHPMTA